MRKRAATILLAGITLLLSSGSIWSDPFVKPELIEDNVSFWKKIYTEVDLDEGVVHDSEYPMIVYSTFPVAEPRTETSVKQIKAQKESVFGSLERIIDLPRTRWNEEDKRIAELFDKYAPPGAIHTAAQRVRFQRGQKRRFREGLERSGRYLDTIRAILKEHDVPSRLAYLPHVESSFRPWVYSKVGAAGMWQFMRGTGANFLTINNCVDERLDPIYSTVAAAKLLSYNYSQVESWPLAITAYNYGLNGMKRAVRKYGTNDFEAILTQHESRTFKFSSRNFYACFLAASEIAEKPFPYFGSIAYHDKQVFQEITLSHWIKPAAIAKALDVSQSALQEINPAILPEVFKSQDYLPKGTRLRLPANLSAGQALYALKQVPDSEKLSGTPERRYTVRSGDTLSRIAARHGVSTSSIADLNRLPNVNAIRIGQVLRIPAQ